jgi:hypothetical protein
MGKEMEPRRLERRYGPREYEGLQFERLGLQLSGNQRGLGVVAHRRSGDRSFCMFHITRFVTKFVTKVPMVILRWEHCLAVSLGGARELKRWDYHGVIALLLLLRSALLRFRMYFLCYRQLNGHRVVVHVAVAIVVASVRAVLKIMGYEFEKT